MNIQQKLETLRRNLRHIDNHLLDHVVCKDQPLLEYDEQADQRIRSLLRSVFITLREIMEPR